ncbi:MAG: SURF1 family protein [Arenicellales bacterium]
MGKLKRLFIILYALGLSLLLGLSYWQYQRGIDKQVLNEKRAQHSMGNLLEAPVNWADFHYRDVRLQGFWRPSNTILLENKIYQGRVGLEVLMPFELLNDQSLLMINRGWVAKVDDGLLARAAEESTLTGVIYQPEKGVELGDAMLAEVVQSKTWPKKSLYLDLALFEQVMQRPLQNVVLVLDENDPASFKRLWKASVMSAEKHFGYAVQWLGLALVFMIYGVIWFRRGASDKPR